MKKLVCCILVLCMCIGLCAAEEVGAYVAFTNVEFEFCSGAGAWRTVLYIEEDGTFVGWYEDADMGDTDDEYPDGTVYVCDFTGKLGELVQVDENTYMASVEEIVCAREAGEEEIAEGLRLVYSAPYGIEKAGDIYIYLPAKAVSELPEGYTSWINMLVELNSDELGFYGLYSAADEAGFVGYTYDSED